MSMHAPTKSIQRQSCIPKVAELALHSKIKALHIPAKLIAFRAKK